LGTVIELWAGARIAFWVETWVTVFYTNASVTVRVAGFTSVGIVVVELFSFTRGYAYSFWTSCAVSFRIVTLWIFINFVSKVVLTHLINAELIDVSIEAFEKGSKAVRVNSKRCQFWLLKIEGPGCLSSSGGSTIDVLGYGGPSG